MIEVRIHGRGGQGAVLASLVVAQAAHRTGYHVQVFPEFGVERRGVPVTAFARLDKAPIRLRTRIYRPDHVVVLDAALARTVPVTDGLRRGGCLVVNAPGAEALAPFRGQGFRLFWVDATSIAAKHRIGTSTAPIVNSTMVGALARATGLYAPEVVGPSMDEVLGEKGPRNTSAALEAYEALQEVVEAAPRAASAGAR